MKVCVDFRLGLLPLLGVLLLVGCQSVPESPAEPTTAAANFPAERYRRLEASDGRVYRLDPRASAVHIYVFRGGKLAAQGHSHVVAAQQLEGAVFLPRRGLTQARFDVVLPVAGLQVDPPTVRAALGGGFATEVGEDARTDTRENMLGPRVLDAERFPRLALSSVTVTGELPKLVVRTAITIRGVTREQWLPVDVRVKGKKLTASGVLLIRQQDYGIEPFTALGGLLSVQDYLLVEFRLVGRSG